MPSMACVVPDFWTFQVRPPSVVAVIVPFMPAAQPFSPTKLTSKSFSFVPDSRAVHFRPPSSVPSTVPASPTTIPRLTSRNVIARSGIVVSMFRDFQVVPPSVVTHRTPC